MSVTAITKAITTLTEAEQKLNLSRTEDEEFFPEWHTNLPELTDSEKTALNELRQSYLYQRAENHLLEATVIGDRRFLRSTIQNSCRRINRGYY